MAPPTINQLRKLRDDIRVACKKIDLSVFKDEHFGPENEYDARGIVSGAQGLATDLAALTKAPKTLLQYSSHSERESLVSSFQGLSNALTQQNLQSAANYIDTIKPIVRDLGIRSRTERQAELIKQVNATQRALTKCDQTLTRLTETQTECAEQLDNIKQTQTALATTEEEIQHQQTETQAAIDAAQKTQRTIDSVSEEIATAHQNVNQLLTEAKSHEEVIETFSKRVSDREKQLEQQKSETDAFRARLQEIEEVHQKLQQEADSLITSARTALQYRTAEGLNEAFQEKYLEARSPALRAGWIAGAAAFTLGAISIGIWIFVNGDGDIRSIVGRISLIPVLMAGAWFCASQYVKQKNLTEDYAYKSVLTKSLVGFADQLSTETDKGQEYSDYIRTVLAEIHRDPLRKRRESPQSHPVNDPATLAEEIVRKISDRVGPERRSGSE